MQRDVLIDHRTKFPNEPRRTSIAIDEVALFTCARCKEYPVCFVCKEEHIKDDKSAELDKEKSKSKSPEKTPNKQANGSQAEPIAIDSDAESADPLDLLRSDRSSSPEEDYRRRKGKGKAKGKLVKQKIATPLLFRCIRCKQAVHYEHREFVPCFRANSSAEPIHRRRRLHPPGARGRVPVQFTRHVVVLPLLPGLAVARRQGHRLAAASRERRRARPRTGRAAAVQGPPASRIPDQVPRPQFPPPRMGPARVAPGGGA